jgi:hypothetical protein
MLIVVLLLILVLTVVIYLVFFLKKNDSEDSPYTEKALPFFGIENGVISMRGGSYCIVIEYDGFDFETSNPSLITALQTEFAEAGKAVCKIGGVASSDISIALCTQQKKLNMTELINATRLASQRSAYGLALFAKNEEEYLTELAAEQPFMQRRNFIAISIGQKALQAEQIQISVSKQAKNSLEAELYKDAGATYKGENRPELPAKKGLLVTLLGGFSETWEEIKSGGASARNTFMDNSSIQTNPVPPAAVSILRQRADIFLAVLRTLRLGGKVLNSIEAAEVIAEMLFMPTKHPAPLIQALDREIRRSDDTSPLPEAENLFIPSGKNPRGQVDVTRFSYVPMEFSNRFTRVGLPTALAEKLTAFHEKRKSEGKSSHLLWQQGFDGKDGRHYQLPRPSYLTTLYSGGWAKEVTPGVLYPLVTRSDVEMTVTIQLNPIPKKKAQSKLQTRAANLELEAQADESPKRAYERRAKAQAIDELQTQLASDDGCIFMTGLRVVVRADNLIELEKSVSTVTSAVSSTGISLVPALNNQALALYSALPFGRDYLSEAKLFGKRTVRNMTRELATCFVPALVPEQADNEGLFVGRGEFGGITRISPKNLSAGHGITVGASGSGKTVSMEVEIGRKLIAEPDLSIIYNDPQGVVAKYCLELNGVVCDMSAEAENPVRLNFLDRFYLGGRPSPFSDTTTVFNSFIALMQNQSLSGQEKATINSALKRLFRHVELGESITNYLVNSFRLRFGDALGMDEERTNLIRQTLDSIYGEITQKYHIPPDGYVVRPVLNPQTGRRKVSFSSQKAYKEYEASWGKAHPDAAVTLIVLKTTARGGRNYYSGEGEYRVQIPLNAYDRIEAEVEARKAKGDLERAAWLATMLASYLGRRTPRRAVLQRENGSWYVPYPAWYLPQTYLDERGRTRLENPESVPGGTIVTDCGPVWYADDRWMAEISAEFAEHFEACELFNELNQEEAQIVFRDAFVPLKFGVPILSDLLPLLAAEAYGVDIVKNLENYVDPDLHGPLFNGHTNQDIHSHFIVFDIKAVTEELRPLRMMQYMQLAWRLISSAPPGQGKQYLMVIDEFGIIANQAPEVASFVGIMYKRSRAFGCTMWLLDQDTSSLQSLAGRHAISNSGIIKIMRQDAVDASYWQAQYNLTPEQVEEIKTFGPGEVLIVLREEGRDRLVRTKYTMSDATLRTLSTRQADVKEYVREQREARGRVGDPLNELFDDVMGHTFAA